MCCRISECETMNCCITLNCRNILFFKLALPEAWSARYMCFCHWIEHNENTELVTLCIFQYQLARKQSK